MSTFAMAMIQYELLSIFTFVQSEFLVTVASLHHESYLLFIISYFDDILVV